MNGSGTTYIIVMQVAVLHRSCESDANAEYSSMGFNPRILGVISALHEIQALDVAWFCSMLREHGPESMLCKLDEVLILKSDRVFFFTSLN